MATGFEIFNALFQVVDIVDACLDVVSIKIRSLDSRQQIKIRLYYLQNSKLVHVLARTGRNHVFQRRKFLIHLGPSSPFDQTMGSFAGNFPPRCTSRAGLLLLAIGRRC